MLASQPCCKERRRPLCGRTMVVINRSGNNLTLHVSGDDFMHAVSLIKSLPSRRYDAESKMWIVPYGDLDNVIETLAPVDVVCNVHETEQIKLNIDDMQIYDFNFLHMPPYPFQIIGASFLINIKQGLLGDEMGLGKTVQAIAAAARLYYDGEATKAIVLCPASLKYQWAEEIEKFTDLSVTVIDGPKSKRTRLYYSDSYFTVLNYELLLRDMDDIQALYPDIIICDEIHRASNYKAKTTTNLLRLDAPYKWGLTGTPVQNVPDEVYSIFSFLRGPNIFGSYWSFRKRYIVVRNMYGRKNVPVGYKNLDELHRKIAPYMLRRMKKDVAKDLPEMIINLRHIEMTDDQKQLHNVVFEDLQVAAIQADALVERDETGQIVHHTPEDDKIMGYFIILQEIADSLELLNMSESPMAIAYNMNLKDSPKLDELADICEDRIANDPHAKTVIFTKFARMQTLIYKRLSKLGKCVVLNGSVPSKERQEMIDQFNTDPNVNFFISTDAGNYGISLQAADCLISVDIPWNPAVFNQRINRIHRINSTHESVEVIVMLSRDSVDDMIYNTMYKKLDMANSILEYTADEKERLEEITTKAIRSIVRKGAK